ncbi:galactoside 2-alpha-L-fucosyltransferase SEC1-like [Mytilus trossulus]|uniref:galactoside 2-alpha-L-fucosyltransferase SEC1-like n=1 Tax=Mytilus trossulus TaxID=6551 RepID=UPI00300449AE
MNFEGRLGNEIFEYASLYGIARYNHMIPVVDDKFHLRRIFKISLTSVKPLANIKRFKEAKACAFDEKAFVLDKKYNWTLSVYLQSWKYFIEYSDDIRKELRFQDTIQAQAVQKFNEIVKARNVTDKNKLTYIAVHVRRGDMLNNKPNVNLGYTTANVNYVNNAMSWFKKKYPSAFFIFASDDIAWCKANFNKPNTAFTTQRNSAAVDMAILSQCNHSIITTGTYGWWSAWLSGGQTIYYKDFPRKGSRLDKVFDAKTYFPPNWIAMSHL